MRAAVGLILPVGNRLISRVAKLDDSGEVHLLLDVEPLFESIAA